MQRMQDELCDMPERPTPTTNDDDAEGFSEDNVWKDRIANARAAPRCDLEA